MGTVNSQIMRLRAVAVLATCGMMALAGAAAVPAANATTTDAAAQNAVTQGDADWSLSRDDDVVARFGLGSDLHVGRSSGQYGTAVDKLERALDAYRQAGVDAIGFSGDLTNYGELDEYRTLMSTLESGTDDDTQVILSMGNHETYSSGVAAAPQRFAEQTGQEINKLVTVNGINVITLGPQNADDDYRADYEFLRSTLDGIAADPDYDPNQPILVLTHHGVQDSAYVTDEWYGEFGSGTDRDLVALMQRYPQIIQVSGHSHATLEDARSIDQSLGFTCIQDGTIGAYFENESGKTDPSDGSPATRPADSELASQGLILDVHRDGTTTIHRMNLATGEWIYPDEPWTVTAAGAQAGDYGKDRPSSAASFADGATVGFDESATGKNSVTVTFPAAEPADGTNNNMIHSYRVTLTPTDGGTPVTTSVFNDYYYAPAGSDGAVPTRKATWSVAVRGLAADTTYTASVEALTSFEEEQGRDGAMIDSGETSVTTSSAPAPGPFFDVNFGLGSSDDYYGRSGERQGDSSAVEDDATLGQQVLHVQDGDGGYRYAMDDDAYDAMQDGFTADVVFSLADVDRDQCVFSNQQSAGFGFEVENGRLEFWMNAGSGRVKPAVAIEADTWYHATAVYDGSTVTLYLNGERVASAAATGGLKIPAQGARYFFIGADTSSSGKPEYQVQDGRIALARISDEVFTDEDVAASDANVLQDGSAAVPIAAKLAVRQALADAEAVYVAGQGSYDDASWSAFVAAYDDALARSEDFRTAPADLSEAATTLDGCRAALTTGDGSDGSDGDGDGSDGDGSDGDGSDGSDGDGSDGSDGDGDGSDGAGDGSDGSEGDGSDGSDGSDGDGSDDAGPNGAGDGSTGDGSDGDTTGDGDDADGTGNTGTGTGRPSGTHTELPADDADLAATGADVAVIAAGGVVLLMAGAVLALAGAGMSALRRHA